MTLLEDPVFWVSISGLVIGAYKFSLSQAYRSKCSNFKLCFGCIDIKRNVDVEARIDEIEMNQHDRPPESLENV